MAQNEITKVLSNRLEKLTEVKRDIDYTLSDKKQAEQMDMPYPTFVKYKGDKAECPISTIVKMAEYYGVSTDYLLGRTNIQSTDMNLQKACDYMRITQKSGENIRAITQSGGNVDILLERNEFKSIVELLNKIKTITVGQRHYNEKIVPNIESNYLLDELFKGSEFQVHIKLLSYIKYAIAQIIERQFSGDMSISNSMIGSPKNCDELYKERLVLTEYKLTELVFRAMINDIKSDTTTDNESFEEFDDQIGDKLDYLLLNLQSNLEDAPTQYTGDKLAKKKQEMQQDIEILGKFIKFYDERYRKDGDPDG